MENSLQKLVEISNYYGKNPEYVIAGGGNTSYKDENYLWIKASGTSLATITEEGFAKMDRKALGKIAIKNYSSDPFTREAEIINGLFECVVGNSGLRPSVETSLHNLLNFSFVVHTHPTLVNGLMCSKNSTRETKLLFGDDALIIEYTDPGYILFKLVEMRIREYVKKLGKEPQIIFLENHGVFVSANTTAEIREIYTDISKRINAKINQKLPSAVLEACELNELKEALSKDKNLCVQTYNSKLINEFTKTREAFDQVSTAFSPDNIVYCKSHYLFIEPDPKTLLAELKKFSKANGFLPKVIAVENRGIICIDESQSAVGIVYEVFLDILKISFLTRNFGGPRFMSPEQIEFIDNWEVENYRRKVARV